MNAVFTFKVSDLIAGLTRSNQWEWHGHCKAEIESSINHLKAELSVNNISECDLVTRHIVANFDRKQAVASELEQELSAAQTDGTKDAMLITYWPAIAYDADRTPPTTEEFLGIEIGLRSEKYELFRAFLTLHFGRPDLIGRITCSFYGFAPSQPGLRIPTKSEFLKGRPYFALDDSSLVFSATPLP
jgi:hypothetical protein